MADIMSTTGYILFSHGSLLCGAGQALEMHAANLSKRLPPAPVEIGYLNYTEPDVSVAVERLAKVGCTHIVVIPYFLVPGYFVTTSLPKRLAEITPNYPGVTVTITDALGVDSRLADAVIDAIATAREPKAESDEVLASAASACRLLETCPFYGGEYCARYMGREPKPYIPAVQTVSLSLADLKNSALLVMIHGSPNESANQPMLDVLEMIRQRGIFGFIQPGFMECNSPDIPNAVDICAEQNIERIIAVPYFLHLGTHVADDLPTLLLAGQAKHSPIEILMTDYLGRSGKVTDVLFDRARTYNR